MSIFGLKVMALVFMVFDHLAEFFPNLMPLEMRWIGRMSAPIFMFCMVQGLVHTSSRKRYLMRLYIGSFIMEVGSFALNIIFSDSVVPITNNIFATLFLIAALITGYESIKQKKQKVFFGLTFLLIQTAIVILIIFIITRFYSNMDSMAIVAYGCSIGGILPNIIFCDGSFLWVILGILMYYFRKSKKTFILMYVSFSLIQILFSLPYGLNWKNLFYTNYQWMMIVSLPIILLYNGTRGKKIKYLFYIFYPVHIWAIFIMSNFAI